MDTCVSIHGFTNTTVSLPSYNVRAYHMVARSVHKAPRDMCNGMSVSSKLYMGDALQRQKGAPSVLLPCGMHARCRMEEIPYKSVTLRQRGARASKDKRRRQTNAQRAHIQTRSLVSCSHICMLASGD